MLQQFPEARLKVYYIWIDVLPQDSSAAAASVAGSFKDPRALHFHDSGELGHSFAAAFGYPDETAWDCYLLYAPGRSWEELPPLPDSFAHQLAEAPEPLQASFRSGSALDEFLTAESSLLLPALP